jgi:hypothetical protein
MNIVEHTPAVIAAPKVAKFFHFSQNNPGGGFYVDEQVTYHVIIEAYNATDANTRAMLLGIYFNGVDAGRDCDCCGDRWSSLWYTDTGDDVPLIYGESPETFKDYWGKSGDAICYVYYIDGSKVTYRKP